MWPTPAVPVDPDDPAGIGATWDCPDSIDGHDPVPTNTLITVTAPDGSVLAWETRNDPDDIRDPGITTYLILTEENNTLLIHTEDSSGRPDTSGYFELRCTVTYNGGVQILSNKVYLEVQV